VAGSAAAVQVRDQLALRQVAKDVGCSACYIAHWLGLGSGLRDSRTLTLNPMLLVQGGVLTGTTMLQ